MGDFKLSRILIPADFEVLFTRTRIDINFKPNAAFSTSAITFKLFSFVRVYRKVALGDVLTSLTESPSKFCRSLRSK